VRCAASSSRVRASRPVGRTASLAPQLSRTQIVAGSKFLHHFLPDLVPPIDRQYTFNFFTGQKRVPSDRAAFLDWFPRLADIGGRCREPIRNAIARRGFMATGEAKVIDNAIMGFIQQLQPSLVRGELASDASR
jgi:hypothetical protein